MAITDISIPTKYVWVQSSEPTGVTTGALWYDTDNGNLYSYSGSAWTNVKSDVSYLDAQQLEQNINILINGASASSTLNDYDEMFLDIFTDSNGYDNTVDTGNTTAYYDAGTDKYKNETISVSATSNLILEMTAHGSSISYSTFAGFIIKSPSNVTYYVFMGTTSSPTYDTTDTNSGGVRYNVTSPTSKTFDLSSAGIFEAGIWKVNIVRYKTDNGSNTATLDSSSYSVDGGAYQNMGTSESTTSTTFQEATISNAPTIISNTIIQTNAQTITANPIGHQVYCHNTVAGTGSITYDISFDGGTTWVTDQEIGSKNTSVHNGTSMIIKLNLKGTGSGNTAEASDYAVMLYYKK